MRNRLALALILVGSLIATSDVIALQSSKPNNQSHITCSDKMGAKHIKKADWQAEHDKCMSDPMGYK